MADLSLSRPTLDDVFLTLTGRMAENETAENETAGNAAAPKRRNRR